MTSITKAAQDALEAMERYQVKRQDFDRFADEITALRAALQDKAGEVPDDVVRYRTIRDGLVYIEPHESGEIYVAGETGVYTNSGDEFDAAIDAIAASQQKGWQHG